MREAVHMNENVPHGWAVVPRAIAVTIVYFSTAALGLLLAEDVSPSVTFVWFPSGLALAAVLFWGGSMLPSVFVGAFAINLLIGEASPPAAAMIALGSTAEALIIAHVFVQLRQRVPRSFRLHLVRGTQPFTEPIDLARLAGAAVLGCAAAATVGTEALLVSGTMTPAEWPTGWLLWCLGDFVGIFLVVPTALIFLMAHEQPE